MARIYKRPGSRYYWLQWHEGGRLHRESLKTSSYAKAKRKLAEKEVELLEPTRTDYRNPTLAEFEAAHHKGMEHLRPATRNIISYHWQMLMDFLNPARAPDFKTNTRLGSIHRADIEALREVRLVAGAKPQSINNLLKDLRRVFRWAIARGLYRDPEPTHGIPRFRMEYRMPEFHTEDELNRLLEAARSISRETEWVVLLGAWAGLRRVEIVSARWEWFSWDTERPVIHVKAYTEDGYRFVLKDREDRTIPMARKIYDVMRPHAQEKGFLFVSGAPSRGKHRYRYEPTRGLLAAITKAKVTDRDPFHRLRHTFASLHAQRGTSLYKIAKWLGNSIDVCQRHYAGLQDYDDEIDGF